MRQSQAQVRKMLMIAMGTATAMNAGRLNAFVFGYILMNRNLFNCNQLRNAEDRKLDSPFDDAFEEKWGTRADESSRSSDTR